MHKRATDVLLNVGLTVVYILAARAGMGFDAVAGFASLVWPPTGISLAALVLFGVRLWPGVFAGAVIAEFVAGAPFPAALAMGIGNTGEAVLGALLLARVHFAPTLESIRSVLGLIGLAAILSTLVSATIGATSLLLSGLIVAGQLAEAWTAWWIGDLVSNLLVAPVIMVWATRPRFRRATKFVEVFALGFMIVATGLDAFFNGLSFMPGFMTPFHQAVLLLIVLMWASLRFGMRGAATASLIISGMAVTATAAGAGPFVRPELHTGLLSLQTFMAGAAATCLLLGASVAEKRAAFEAMRRAQEEASEANLVKSEFLAVMSHELRTPLNAIAGFAELLRSDVHGPLNEKQADDVERIARNEKQLLAVIDQVLGFVSAEKGTVRVEPRAVEIAGAFDAVEPIVRQQFDQKHSVLQRELARPQLAVMADPESLQEILVSLLSNASKYSGDGASITLGAEPHDGKNVRIWVSDTGIGISDDEIKRVFEPFFQADRGTTRRTSGIGLGLTIARDLARRMAGELTIASKLGAGTTASIVLPAA